VFKSAILANAVAIIVCHNHPSGELVPSDEDIKLTKQLIEAGELLGIKVLDHLIVSNQGYKSLRDYHKFSD
jgi:DNA repair protein RadC